MTSDINTWDEWCDMMDGASDCEKGIDNTQGRSKAYRFGWAQEYARLEGMTAQSLEAERGQSTVDA